MYERNLPGRVVDTREMLERCEALNRELHDSVAPNRRERPVRTASIGRQQEIVRILCETFMIHGSQYWDSSRYRNYVEYQIQCMIWASRRAILIREKGFAVDGNVFAGSRKHYGVIEAIRWDYRLAIRYLAPEKRGKFPPPWDPREVEPAPANLIPQPT